MTKEDIVAHLADEAGTSKATAAKILTSLTDLITDRAAHGLNTDLHGFGCFKPKTRKARVARNPKTGEQLQLPERQAMTFRAAKRLLDAMN